MSESINKDNKTAKELTSQLNNNQLKILKLYSVFCDRMVKEDVSLMTRVKTVRKSLKSCKDKSPSSPILLGATGNAVSQEKSVQKSQKSQKFQKPSIRYLASCNKKDCSKNKTKFHEHILPGKFHKSKEELISSGCITGKYGVPHRILKSGIFDLIYNINARSSCKWLKAADVIGRKNRCSFQSRLNPRPRHKPKRWPRARVVNALLRSENKDTCSEKCTVFSTKIANSPEAKAVTGKTLSTFLKDQPRKQLTVTVSETDLTTIHDRSIEFDSGNKTNRNTVIMCSPFLRRSRTFTHSDFYLGCNNDMLRDRPLIQKSCVTGLDKTGGEGRVQVLRRNKSEANFID